ncbi:MAG: hypothetical protein ACRC26_04435 [Bacteroidales bacterium]
MILHIDVDNTSFSVDTRKKYRLDSDIYQWVEHIYNMTIESECGDYDRKMAIKEGISNLFSFIEDNEIGIINNNNYNEVLLEIESAFYE